MTGITLLTVIILFLTSLVLAHGDANA